MVASRLARVAAATLTIAAAHPAVSAAECKPDTSANRARTLINGIAAFHFDYAGSTISVNDTKSASMLSGEMSLALCRWPAYTIGVGGETLMDMIETSYIAPGSADFHPSLSLSFSSVSLTRRWRNLDIVHPMISVRAGSVDAEYSYYHTVAGRAESHVDGKSSAPFVAPMAGVEISVFKYMTVYLNAGDRIVGSLNTPGLTNNLSGMFTTFGMAFGKFR
jgi:hypothetical protein